MTGSAPKRWTLYVMRKLIYLYQGEGFGEGKSKKSARIGPWRIFFGGSQGHFFRCLFRLRFWTDFSSILEELGGFLEPKMAPEIDFWSDFFDVFLVPSFCSFLCWIFVVFLKLETLKIVFSPRRELNFWGFVFLALAWQMAWKCMPKSMDFEFENGEKSMQERSKKHVFFHVDFSSILVPFWKGLGFQMEVKMDQRWGN